MRLRNSLKIVGLALAILGLGFLLNFSSFGVWSAAAMIFLGAVFYLYTETSFYILVAYLPFQLAFNLAADADLLSGRIFILLLFSVWLIKGVKEGGLSWSKQRKPELLALFLILIISAVSVLVASNQGWWLRKILVFVSIFPFFLLVVSFINKTRQVKKLLLIMTISAGLSSLVALGQFLAQFIFSYQAVAGFWGRHLAALFWGQSFAQTVVQNPSWYVNVGGQTLMRAIGLFPDPHMLAFYLGLTSPLILVLAFSEKRFRAPLLVVYCLAFMVLLLTFSRGGYLGLISSISVMGLVAWRQLGQRIKILISGIFLMAVAAVILTPVFGRLSSSFNLSEGSNFNRLAIWVQSLDQIKKSPLLGVGLGNYPLSLDFNAAYRSAVTSHDLYLDILAETGIFALLAWLWFLGAALRGALEKVKKSDGLIYFLAVGLVGSLTYFLTHSFFETAIFNPTILAFLMLVAGLACALSNLTEKNP